MEEKNIIPLCDKSSMHLRLIIRPDKLDLLFLISARFYFKHPLQLSLLPFASGTPLINAINNHVMSRGTSCMASAHGHLNNEVMNNNRPPAPKFRKWLMRNNKSSLSGLIDLFHIS